MDFKIRLHVIAKIGVNGRPSNAPSVIRFGVLFGVGDLKRTVMGFKSTPIFHSRKVFKILRSVHSPRCDGISQILGSSFGSMVIDASNSDQTKLQRRKKDFYFFPHCGDFGFLMYLREKTWFANPLNSRLMYICHAPSTPYNSKQPNQEVNNQRLLFSSMISGTERSAGLLKGGLSEPRSSKFKALTLVMDCLRFRWRRRMIMSSSI
ncbi:hypothetical protein HID58_047907 [Brassica napus]|uniref:Uncharacterized protein n=1 Tax=Brassica napus TaxID=3708 RepID=A0ABQ8B0L9_BRANA|nr:hypothetical protein HID58_047907 [Brassica napus]